MLKYPKLPSSPIAENGDIVVFSDIAENGDIISPFSTYPPILGDTKGCIERPESATPEFDKRQYFETFHLVF